MTTEDVKKVIEINEVSLKRYREEAKKNPKSLFWKGLVREMIEQLEELKSELEDLKNK